MSTASRIHDHEWDFTQIPNERLIDAFVWECGRTQEWLCRAVKSRNSAAPAGDVMQPPSPVPFGRNIVRRRQATRSEVERWKLGTNRIIETLALRKFSGRPTAKFLNHNLRLVFTAGFPDRPFQSAKNPSAIIEHFNTMPLDAAYELNPNVVAVKGPLNPMWEAVRGSSFAHKARMLVPEVSGEVVDFGEADGQWRKFTLAIDWHRTDEEIIESVRRFLKDARVKHGLRAAKKPRRASRGGIPSWLTQRFAGDALFALSASRLIRAFGGDARAAHEFARQRKREDVAKTCVKDFRRTAAALPKFVATAFGTAV